MQLMFSGENYGVEQKTTFIGVYKPQYDRKLKNRVHKDFLNH